MNALVAGLAGLVALALSALWIRRRLPDAAARSRIDRAEAAVAALPAFGRDAPSLERLLAATRDAAIDGFGARDVVFFEPGLFQKWDARALGDADAPLLVAPDETAGQVFAWVAQRGGVVTTDDAGAGVPDAVLVPLRAVFAAYDVSVLIPVSDRGDVLGVLGLIGARPRGPERDLLEAFRSILAATAANVRLDRETAEPLGLEEQPSEVGRVQARARGVAAGHAGPVSWATGIVTSGDAPEAFAVAAVGEGGIVLAAVGLPVMDSPAAAPLVGVSLGAAALAVARSPGADPARVAHAVARVVAHAPPEARATTVACVVDPAGKLRHAAAAHPPPYVLDAKGLHALPGAGPLLGGADVDAARVDVGERALAPGALVILVGDGVLGAEGPGGERFGHRQLQLVLTGLAGKTAVEVRDALLGAVATFRDGGRPIADEACAVVRWGG